MNVVLVEIPKKYDKPLEWIYRVMMSLNLLVPVMNYCANHYHAILFGFLLHNIKWRLVSIFILGHASFLNYSHIGFVPYY